jgi:UDP-glucuronate 4-epimerase
MKILITGAAGFIGMHLAEKLLQTGHTVVGIDNLNEYYDVALKHDRIKILTNYKKFIFHKDDVTDDKSIELLFDKYKFTQVVHLAAQAGVRYSLKNPRVYIESNLTGFFNILEYCKQHQIKHFVFASTSSVYGANTSYPFTEQDVVDHPVSLYAATKKANELMAHSYASLYKLPCTGLRFFTVYGPWGRPDMALFKFTHNILTGLPIEIYNNGEMYRDFTYIDDIVTGVIAVLKKPARVNVNWSGNKPDSATSYAPYRIYNIGNNAPIKLMNFIAILEEEIGKKADKKFMPLQQGDMLQTYSDTTRLNRDFNYLPKTDIRSGIRNFLDWYLQYYA